MQGHSVTVNVVACRGKFCQSRRIDGFVCYHEKKSLLTSVTVWTLPLMVREVADEQ